MNSTILNTLLDLFFPVSCRRCQQPKNKISNPSGVLCFECRSKIFLNDWVFCPLCNKKLAQRSPRLAEACLLRRSGYEGRVGEAQVGEGGNLCLKHRSSLKWLGVASNYDDKILKSLIWDYKYGFNENLAEVFSEMMFGYFEKITGQVELNKKNLVLSFVPLAPKKLRWRGFNQSRLLAKGLARKTGFAIVDSLERKTYSSPQMSLETKQQRFQNIKNSFEARSQKEVRGKDIILVDDVCATGATLIEAAKTLKQAGARNIYGLVLARKL